jgi:hypothetical protein
MRRPLEQAALAGQPLDGGAVRRLDHDRPLVVEVDPDVHVHGHEDC